MKQAIDRTSRTALMRSPAGPSWMLTFTDLIGILLAFFVLLYSFGDRSTAPVNAIMNGLTLSLRAPDTLKASEKANTAILSHIGYQTALLEKSITDLEGWSLDDSDPNALTLELKGIQLRDSLVKPEMENVLHVIERFKTSVSIRVKTSTLSSVTGGLSDIDLLARKRAELGLTAPWRLAVATEDGALSGSTRIIISKGTRLPALMRKSDEGDSGEGETS